jgi:Zn-dependent metalloprotease
MHNKNLYIHTHDLDYDCIKIANTNLPGQYANGFSPIDPMAISAHKNTETVVTFIRDVLDKNYQYIDSKQKLEFISTVKCLERTNKTNEWRNACWLPGFDQVVYGQELIDGQLKSYGKNLEIVAHEFFHGIIQYTAKLNSRGESGALNESYADIFAVLILVPTISTAVAAIINIEVAILFPFVGLALLAIIKLGLNTWCSVRVEGFKEKINLDE